MLQIFSRIVNHSGIQYRGRAVRISQSKLARKIIISSVGNFINMIEPNLIRPMSRIAALEIKRSKEWHINSVSEDARNISSKNCGIRASVRRLREAKGEERRVEINMPIHICNRSSEIHLLSNIRANERIGARRCEGRVGDRRIQIDKPGP
jgi:hypothetical protein